MEDTVVLEWVFSPADYFDQELEIPQNGYVLRIANGKVAVEVASSAYDKDPNYRKVLHKKVNRIFLVAQVLSHRSYTLSEPSMGRHDSEGRPGLFITPEPATCTVSTVGPDVIIKDEDGKIISSTRLDRQEWLKEHAAIAVRFSDDTTLTAMLASYDAAVSDPSDELIHLFEIIEAVTTRFGSRRKASSELAIAFSDLDWLAKLSNREPLTQGRHRGKHVGELRSATTEQLSRARTIARDIIERYLRCLNK